MGKVFENNGPSRVNGESSSDTYPAFFFLLLNYLETLGKDLEMFAK